MNLLKIGIIVGVLSVLSPQLLLAKDLPINQGLNSKNEQRNLKKCQEWPDAIKNMPVDTATITSHSGQIHKFQYRFANTTKFMQHGFQFVCAETIAKTQMLFEFEFPQTPSFHMNNVLAPLDIAFIDQNGTITDIFLMKIYSKIDSPKALYSPSKNILYALEAREGYFAELGVKVGDYVGIKK